MGTERVECSLIRVQPSTQVSPGLREWEDPHSARNLQLQRRPRGQTPSPEAQMRLRSWDPMSSLGWERSPILGQNTHLC